MNTFNLKFFFGIILFLIVIEILFLSNAILKRAPQKKKIVKFILENQKATKKGVKKQLAYTANRVDEKKTVKIAGKELSFTSTPKVKACLKTNVK